MHGHFELDPLARLQAQEVDMRREILDDVELIVARDRALLLAVDVEFEDRRQEVSREDQLGDLARIERERGRSFAGRSASPSSAG